MNIEFRPLTSSDCTEFQELLAIYHEAFPPEEREPGNILRENIDSGLARAFIATDAAKVIFFLITYSVPETQFIFLDYAATHRAYRGNKIAQCFFRQAFSSFGHDRILFGEQEDPNYGENRDNKWKRIAYFRGIGFQYLHDIPYLLPDHSGGPDSTPMVLCVLAQNPLSTLPGQQITKAITFIFTQVYRRSEDDALLLHNLRAIPDEIGVSVPLVTGQS